MIPSMERLLRTRDAVIAAVRPVGAERLPVADAAGRWLAAEARATAASPLHTCAAMDGYAIRAADAHGAVRLTVRGAAYAGELPAVALGAGEAVRIFTGAPLPPGADAVVRQEAAREEQDLVSLNGPVRPGENVRPAGEDVPQGGQALPEGVRLGPRQLALLVAVATAEVLVRRRPRVAILTTGDEIASGRTPDSNGVALAALCGALGAVVARRVVPDRPEAVRAALEQARAAADAIVTVGGVSVGVRDLVPGALDALGAETRVHGVPMKPGKPFLFALLGGTPVLGLPGSPSACLAAFEVFARPALLALSGASRLTRPEVPVRVVEALEGRPGRARLLWAELLPGGWARPVGRDAAQVRGPALADALLLVPADAGTLPAGAEVAAWLLAGDV
jgi:molybdopterin molybdotransferase